MFESETLRLYDDGKYVRIGIYEGSKQFYDDGKYKLMGNAIDLFYNSTSAFTYIIDELTAERMTLKRDFKGFTLTGDNVNVKEI